MKPVTVLYSIRSCPAAKEVDKEPRSVEKRKMPLRSDFTKPVNAREGSGTAGADRSLPGQQGRVKADATSESVKQLQLKRRFRQLTNGERGGHRPDRRLLDRCSGKKL